MERDLVPVTQYKYGIINCDLNKPYELSFVTLNQIKSIWVYIEDENGQKGLGEAVPLPGYSFESVANAFKCIKNLGHGVNSLTIGKLRKRCSNVRKKHPFAASAVMAAIDFPNFLDTIPAILPVSIVFPLSASWKKKELLKNIEKAISEGYKHFKVKIGKVLSHDIECAKTLFSVLTNEEYTVSFDANKSYTLNQALTFCETLEIEDSKKCSLLEQPLPVNEWDSMIELSQKTSIKFMLDESIYDENDVDRATTVGCRAIKLKLFKNFGLLGTLKLAKFAKKMGLEVVIGNGVSTDIGNLGEVIIISSAPETFYHAAECNGFVKLKHNIAFPELTVNISKQVEWKGCSPIDLSCVVTSLEKNGKANSEIHYG